MNNKVYRDFRVRLSSRQPSMSYLILQVCMALIRDTDIGFLITLERLMGGDIYTTV